MSRREKEPDTSPLDFIFLLIMLLLVAMGWDIGGVVGAGVVGIILWQLVGWPPSARLRGKRLVLLIFFSLALFTLMAFLQFLRFDTG